MDKTTLVIAFFVAAVLAGLFLQFSSKGLPAPSTKEHFMQKAVGAPVDGPGMGPYDAVSLGGGISGFMTTEPHGAAPITGILPSSATDNKLMYLVGNKVDSSCCPAAFNTDTGCVCLTEDDKNFMASRGGNKA